MANRTVFRDQLWAGASVVLAATLAQTAMAEVPFGQANYSGTARIQAEGEKPQDIKVYVSGLKTRMELANFEDLPGDIAVSILDPEQDKVVVYAAGKGLKPEERIAMSLSPSRFSSMLGVPTTVDTANPTLLKVGDDVVAGKSCAEYQITDLDEDGLVATRLACLTSDGAMLRMREKVGTKPEFEMLSYQDGPQPPILFTVPAGYQTLDMDAMMAGIPDLAALGGLGNGQAEGDPGEQGVVDRMKDRAGQTAENRVGEEVDKKVNSIFDSIFGGR